MKNKFYTLDNILKEKECLIKVFLTKIIYIIKKDIIN